jgi:DNA polymerase III delta prime subunit
MSKIAELERRKMTLEVKIKNLDDELDRADKTLVEEGLTQDTDVNAFFEDLDNKIAAETAKARELEAAIEEALSKAEEIVNG